MGTIGCFTSIRRSIFFCEKWRLREGRECNKAKHWTLLKGYGGSMGWFKRKQDSMCIRIGANVLGVIFQT
jgi:hypothetical protein